MRAESIWVASASMFVPHMHLCMASISIHGSYIHLWHLYTYVYPVQSGVQSNTHTRSSMGCFLARFFMGCLSRLSDDHTHILEHATYSYTYYTYTLCIFVHVYIYMYIHIRTLTACAQNGDWRLLALVQQRNTVFVTKGPWNLMLRHRHRIAYGTYMLLYEK